MNGGVFLQILYYTQAMLLRFQVANTISKDKQFIITLSEMDIECQLIIDWTLVQIMKEDKIDDGRAHGILVCTMSTVARMHIQ